MLGANIDFTSWVFTPGSSTIFLTWQQSNVFIEFMLDSILDSIEIEPINVPKRLAEIRINPKSTLIQLAGDIRLMRARLNSIFNS